MKLAYLGLAVGAWYAFAPPARPLAQRAQGAQGDNWNWHGRLAQGKTLEIRGINGDVIAGPAGGDEIEVTAVKHGRRSDPADVRIEVVENANGVTICAVYPGDNNRCEPGGGHMNTRNNDVEVRFAVKVPRGVRYEGYTVNGDAEALGMTGDVSIATVNGSARLETQGGEASANTVNGSVTATVHAMGQRPMRFETVNGGVTLTLPAGLDADLEASTVNGAIDTDFPVQVTGRMTPRHLAGTIGHGGRRLHVSTVNGSVQLRKQ
jgi:hypothetical protein